MAHKLSGKAVKYTLFSAPAIALWFVIALGSTKLRVPATKYAVSPYDYPLNETTKTPLAIALDDGSYKPEESIQVPRSIYYDPAGPLPHQILILCAGDGQGHNAAILDVVEKATENRRAYAEYHGYEFIFIDLAKYPLPPDTFKGWAKIPALIEAFKLFPEVQWIWWLDLDAIIMTPTVDLNSLLLSHAVMSRRLAKGAPFTLSDGKTTGKFTSENPDPMQIDIITTQDLNGLNTGSMFFRRSPITRVILDTWFDPLYLEKNWDHAEQDAIKHILAHHHTIREHIGVVHQRAINAYAWGGPQVQFQEGDLVVHFAGCWFDKACQQRWDQYWSLRKLAPTIPKTANAWKWKFMVDNSNQVYRRSQ